MIAHRGASAYAPENTLAAFELAVAQGADMLELDVHLTADDQPVIIHDDTLGRTTTGRGRVRDHSLQALKRLDAGAWRGGNFRGQRLQSLPEVLERFRDRIGFAVELKAGSARYPGIEERVVSLLEVYGVVGRALVLAFDHAALPAVRALNPELGRVALVDSVPRPSILRGPRVRAAREAGLDVYVWTVNDPTLMDRLIGWEVTGIITDAPDVLRARPALA
ncbi:MAG: glycerophosphodiester phosphodiesterase [Candidatus Rokubacteria bacterium]|nr:glycerophosphodiester phosphodiesterase [Candidatus Rokubacteria bacterium]